MNSQVQYFLARFTGERRHVVEMWFGRAGRYLGMIREVLRSQGLPEDLAFTVMIESGFNPLAVSRAGAKGLWQFMASTARRYGLRVDQWVDERFDPERSTVAAAAYLRDLYEQFGSWVLAQAAYNAGEVKMARAIRATRSTDFWTIAGTGWLRRETREFVPQILAATMIGREPSRYGFDVGERPTIEYESLPVAPSTDFRRLSAATGIPTDTLRSLNPALIRSVTPPGSPYEIRIPGGSRATVLAALAPPARPAVARTSSHVVRASGGADIHVVRPRDTLSAIAKRYGVSVEDMVRWNGLESQDRIRPGDRLRVADLRVSAARDGVR
ncbi:MAG: transglycosylase SLT domain-containing protein [Candidatus Rokubacteria bacterium]|nr:transglycosylase SLT domain-containing protein [Candidatus Rokubacteria bacterium]